MENFKETFSEFRCELCCEFKQIFYSTCQAILQDIRDVVENFCSKLCQVVEDVLLGEGEFHQEGDLSPDNENGLSSEIPGDKHTLVIKELQLGLQDTEVVLLRDCVKNKMALVCGRLTAEKSGSLKGAVGLFDFFMKNALCVTWIQVNVLVYFE